MPFSHIIKVPGGGFYKVPGGTAFAPRYATLSVSGVTPRIGCVFCEDATRVVAGFEHLGLLKTGSGRLRVTCLEINQAFVASGGFSCVLSRFITTGACVLNIASEACCGGEQNENDNLILEVDFATLPGKFIVRAYVENVGPGGDDYPHAYCFYGIGDICDLMDNWPTLAVSNMIEDDVDCFTIPTSISSSSCPWPTSSSPNSRCEEVVPVIGFGGAIELTFSCLEEEGDIDTCTVCENYECPTSSVPPGSGTPLLDCNICETCGGYIFSWNGLSGSNAGCDPSGDYIGPNCTISGSTGSWILTGNDPLDGPYSYAIASDENGCPSLDNTDWVKITGSAAFQDPMNSVICG